MSLACQPTRHSLRRYTVVHGITFLPFDVASAGLFALGDEDRHVLFAMFRHARGARGRGVWS
jgi:hypothetical protein